MDLYLPMGGPLTLLQSRQCALYVLLSLSIFAMGWRPSPEGSGAPTGCEMVFAATSRGGAMASVGGGGGCNIFRRSENGRSKVVRVVDGDTIKVSGGRRVRYLGIDTPEVGEDPEPYGPEATDFNRSLVGGRVVYLKRDVSDEDRFKRLLRFVYADGILVNAELVREGYARAKVYPPDTRYAECFAALELEAREAGRGMWEADDGEEGTSGLAPRPSGPTALAR